jgi:hypothetical protein
VGRDLKNTVLDGVAEVAREVLRSSGSSAVKHPSPRNGDELGLEISVFWNLRERSGVLESKN